MFRRGARAEINILANEHEIQHINMKEESEGAGKMEGIVGRIFRLRDLWPVPA